MRRVLLDTHVLLWAPASPERLSTPARALIDEAVVFVSAASLWEISIKAALGRLEAHSGDVLAALPPAGFELLSISGEHAARVAVLPHHHRDPFDRMLIAQAQAESLQLLTHDNALTAYGADIMLA